MGSSINNNDMNGMRKQVPSVQGNWLWHDMSEHEYDRYFTTVVFHPDGDPDWPECDNAFKEDWEARYPKPQPQPEPEQETQQ